LENLEPNFRFRGENFPNLNLNLKVQVQECSVQVQGGVQTGTEHCHKKKKTHSLFGQKV